MSNAKLNVSAEETVAIGREGFLYLKEGAQTVLAYVSGAKEVPEHAYQRFNENLRSRAAHARETSASYLHCVCPDKQTVIPEHFPFDIRYSAAKSFSLRCETNFIIPVDALRASGSSYGYLKTDTHWDYAGRVAVATDILTKLGIDISEIVAKAEQIASLSVINDNYSGDLGNKFEPKIVERANLCRDGDSVAGVFIFSNKITGNNGLINVSYNLNAKNSRRLLIFGDSFILHCLPVLSLFFRQVFFLRTPYYHKEIVASFEPTHIVTANAERYLPSTTKDVDACLGLLLASLAGTVWSSDVRHARAINASLQPKSAHSNNFWAELSSLQSN